MTHERDTLDRTWSDDLDLRLTDTCLRDGSHHKRHQFTAQEVHDIVEALDSSGIPVIEVTHGDGLGGSSFNYGFSKTPEQELIKIAAETAKRAQDRVPDAARASAPRTTSAPPRTTAARSAGSPPTAPRRTPRSSTSAWPASSAWRPSAS